MDRASAVVVNNGRVALIERERGIRAEKYFVHPGGGIEAGETVESAIVREVFEETVLIVPVERPRAPVQFRGMTRHYHLVSILGGEFGTGSGPEMTGAYGEAHGSYKAVWMDIGNLLDNPVYPTCISTIVHFVEMLKSRYPLGKVVFKLPKDSGHHPIIAVREALSMQDAEGWPRGGPVCAVVY